MKKILITLLLTTGFSCLSLNAQKPLKKPQKKHTVTTPNKPQKAQAQSKKPTKKPQKAQTVISHEHTKPQFRTTPNDSVRPQPERTPNEPIRTQETNSQPSTPQPVLTGTINGHEYVDLGLSVKWATCNVGASSPSDYGDYFAWGETSTKLKYTEKKSVTYKKSMSDIAGDSRYDAARAQWGGTWRLPTKAEIDELEKRCKTQWTTYNGHKGRLVTGPNGKSIFLSAAGLRYGTSLCYVGEYGFYWSSTPYESDSRNAYYLSFSSSYFYRYLDDRYYGRTVRPVSE